VALTFKVLQENTVPQILFFPLMCVVLFLRRHCSMNQRG